MSGDTIVVFAGPSLPTPCEAEDGLSIQRLGPAAQGDVLRAALLYPAAIVLIDGFFEAFPAVYHKEILWALNAGIPVYGAASTGALRAAELHSFGMVGVGEIFDAFVDGTLIRDDEVALIHAPKEVGYSYLSEPLVNMRWTLNSAVSENILTSEIAAQLLSVAEAEFYPNRSYDSLLSACEPMAAHAVEGFRNWLSNGRVDQKNMDARACMARVASDFEAGILPVAAPFDFQHTDAFDTLLNEVLSDCPASDPDTLERVRAASPEGGERLRVNAEIAELALALDRQSPHPVPLDELAREVSEFRQHRALHDQDALMQWLALRDLDIDTLSRRLEERAKIARARRSVQPRLDERMRNLLTFADASGGTI
jgi:hypothetical protein